MKAKQIFRLVTIMFLIGYTSVYAQPKGKGQREQAKNFVTELKEKLKLNDEQTAKIKGIMAAHRKNMDEKVWSNKNLSREEKMKIMREERAKTDEQIMNVLDENQKQIYAAEKDKLRENLREQARSKRHSKR